MGFLKKDDTCAVCGNKTNVLTRVKLTDGFLCATCKTWCSDFVDIKSMSSEAAKAHIAKTLKDESLYKSMVATDSVKDFLVVYKNDRAWSCCVKKGETPYLFSFDDIIDYELLEDGMSVTKGGLGSAAAGALLLGGVGAIVGGGLGKKQKDVVQRVSIRISTKVPLMSHVEIPILKAETEKGSFLYKSAKDIAFKVLSLLDQISLQEDQIAAQGNRGFSEADEILKYKQLLDSGVITQEEFEAKKRQLLGI